MKPELPPHSGGGRWYRTSRESLSATTGTQLLKTHDLLVVVLNLVEVHGRLLAQVVVVSFQHAEALAPPKLDCGPRSTRLGLYRLSQSY